MFLLKLLFGFTVIFTINAATCNPKTQKQCSANEEFVIGDQYRCQNTCEYYGRDFDCQGYDAPRGDCYCRKGFARLFECGPCVSITEPACKLVLPPTEESCRKQPNQYFSPSGSPYLCGNTCRNVGIPCDRVVIQVVRWAPMCECVEGFARLNGKCVALDLPACYDLYKPSPEYCKRRNELYSPFGSACQRTCANYQEYNMCWDDNVRTAQPMILKGDCYCPKGTTRIFEGGVCIPIKDCPAATY